MSFYFFAAVVIIFSKPGLLSIFHFSFLLQFRISVCLFTVQGYCFFFSKSSVTAFISQSRVSVCLLVAKVVFFAVQD